MKNQPSTIYTKYRITEKGSHEAAWIIASSSGHDYKVTVFEKTPGKWEVSGCEQTNGDICEGWHYRRACHHAVLATRREQEHQQRVPSTPQETSQKGSLHSARPFSLMR